jgi:Cupin-like domain
MLEIITGFFIFCVILFLYLHIQFHLKTSDDLEIYEIDQASKDKMEEICDLRQPVLFDCDEDSNKIIQTTNKITLLDNYPVFEVKIRDCKNIHDIQTSSKDFIEELYVPLPLHIACKLFDQDNNAEYFSENNSDFLNETGAVKNMSYNDEFLRPYLVSNCNYDIMFGSNQVSTPFRYELNYRNYFIVTQGSLKIKLAPPKSSKYLYPVNDYENFEFRSQIDPWKPQTKFKADFDKIKCLEIVLTPGKFLFIPAYWWYSFKFTDNTSVSCFRYRTYMNNIAISPNIAMYALQNQNVERKIAKKIDINELNDSKSNTNTNFSNNTTVERGETIETIEINNSTVETIETNNSTVETTEISDIPSILIPQPLNDNDQLGQQIL